jgi:hypothetical protein
VQLPRQEGTYFVVFELLPEDSVIALDHLETEEFSPGEKTRA